MEFPSVKKVAFGKSACSPEIPTDSIGGLFLNMPSKITWGDELPLCVGLKDDKKIEFYTNANFSLLVEQKGVPKIKESFVQELGDPNLSLSRPQFNSLRKDGVLFFAIDGRHPFRPLPPGSFEVSVSYLDFVSAKQTLAVVAGGWRSKFSKAVIREVCEGQLMQDLERYFEQIEVATRVEFANAHEEAEFHKKTEAFWVKGYTPYKAKIEADWPMASNGKRQKLDETFSFYISEQLRERCPGVALKDRVMLDFIQGLNQQR